MQYFFLLKSFFYLGFINEVLVDYPLKIFAILCSSHPQKSVIKYEFQSQKAKYNK